MLLPKRLVLLLKQIHKMRQEVAIIFPACLFYDSNHEKNGDSLGHKN